MKREMQQIPWQIECVFPLRHGQLDLAEWRCAAEQRTCSPTGCTGLKPSMLWYDSLCRRQDPRSMEKSANRPIASAIQQGSSVGVEALPRRKRERVVSVWERFTRGV